MLLKQRYDERLLAQPESTCWLAAPPNEDWSLRGFINCLYACLSTLMLINEHIESHENGQIKHFCQSF